LFNGRRAADIGEEGNLHSPASAAMLDCDQRYIIVQSRDEEASHRQLGIHDIRRVVPPVSIRDSIQTGISDTQNNLQTLG
jgi:hypothetical protein